MAISNSTVRSNAGLGVGSRFDEVLRAYPTAKVAGCEQYGLYLAIHVPDSGLAFSFDVAGLTSIQLQNASVRRAEFSGRLVEWVFIQ
jgi:hypothetical protein